MDGERELLLQDICNFIQTVNIPNKEERDERNPPFPLLPLLPPPVLGGFAGCGGSG